MKTKNLLWATLLGAIFITGCVSTTTGSITEPVRDDKDAAELNYQLGARYFNAGNYELARDRLMLAVELSPKMAVAYTILGMTYEGLDNLRLAREAYEKSVAVAPRDYEANNAYAVFLCRQKDYPGAQRYFERAADHAENDTSEETLTNAGICMLQKPDVVAAEALFRKALERKSNYPDALLQLCALKFQEKDYLSARAFLQRFMSSNLPSPDVLYLASRIEDLLDNDRGRTEFEDRLIREFPRSEEARKVLGAK